MKNRLILFLVTIIIGTSVKSIAQDADSDFTEPLNRKKISFVVTPYFWLAGQSSDVGGEKLRQSFNDLSSLTNFGFQLSALLRYKRFILYFDGTYANLGTTDGSDNLKIKFSIDQWIIDSKVGYILYEDITYDENEVIKGVGIEANIGSKQFINNIGIDYALIYNGNTLIQDEFHDQQKWRDLMLGVKTRLVLNKSVLLGISLNAGGFGILNSSDMSWDLTYLNVFRVSNLMLVSAGYRTLNYKRTDGEGENRIKTKVAAYGPVLGVSFAF